MAVPYLGARISLVSKSEVRYEGTLYNINTADATVALQNVKAFGTEGRRQNGPQIPANPEIFEYVIFKGSDIKDLRVCEAAPEPSAFEDPAIVSSKMTTSSDTVSSSPSKPLNATPPASPSRAVQSGASTQTRKSMANTISRAAASNLTNQQEERGFRRNAKESSDNGFRRNQRGRGGHNSGFVRNQPGTAAYLRSRRTRTAEDTQAPEAGSNFDFTSMNEKFNKEEEFAKLSLSAEVAENDQESEEEEGGFSQGYDKTSFFDNISSDVTDRESRKDNRMRTYQERQLNKETFGAIGLTHNYRHRGGYHGGRGGFRGRGRGRGNYRGGGGGYQNSSKYRGRGGFQHQSNGRGRGVNNFNGTNNSFRGRGQGARGSSYAAAAATAAATSAPSPDLTKVTFTNPFESS